MLSTLAFLTLGCAPKMETAKDSCPDWNWFPFSNDVIWVEIHDRFDPNDPDRVTEKRFYTNDLARAQDRVSFPIVLPGYIPDKAKRISLPWIEGPLIAESDNETEVIVRYVIQLSDVASSEIFITESNYEQSLADPELNPYVAVTEIGGKQVLKTEFDHLLGPAIYLSFSSDNIFFVVELYNFPTDEATKIVESIIEPTTDYTSNVEPEIVVEPEAVAEPQVVPETEIILKTEIVLEPDISSTSLSPENTIADTIAGIEARLNALEIKGATVKKQDSGLIVVQLPKVEDIDLVVALITSRGELDFRERVVDAHGFPVLNEEGNEQWVIAKAKGSDGQERELTGKYLKPNAQVVLEPQTNQPEVDFDWNEEGAVLFEQITQRNLWKPLGIFLDGKLISAPKVMAMIKDKGVITGLNLDEARTLTAQLNSGALPVPLSVVKIESIGKD